MFHQEAYEKARQRIHKTCRNSRVKGRTLGNGGGRCKCSDRGGEESSDSKRKLHCRKCNVDCTGTDGTNPKTLLMEVRAYRGNTGSVAVVSSFTTTNWFPNRIEIIRFSCKSHKFPHFLFFSKDAPKNTKVSYTN